MGVGEARDPVAERLVDRVLERLAAGVDGRHLGAQKLHAVHVQALAAHVLLAHVDDAVEPKERGGGRGRDTVLAGAGLGDDPRLAHLLRQQHLAQSVVDLVRAGVQQVLALEVDARTAEMLGQPLSEVERRRAADVVLQQVLQPALEGALAPQPVVGAAQFLERRHQGFRRVAAAVNAVAAALVGFHGLGRQRSAYVALWRHRFGLPLIVRRPEPPSADAGGNPCGAISRHTRTSPCTRRRVHGWHAGAPSDFIVLLPLRGWRTIAPAWRGPCVRATPRLPNRYRRRRRRGPRPRPPRRCRGRCRPR